MTLPPYFKDKSLPLQKGSDDCGVMTLSYAKFLLCDKEVFKVNCCALILAISQPGEYNNNNVTQVPI